jgi:MerR family copper efflux transcriptional regulator
MLISEFSRATGLTPDTIRFYIRRGLLQPETGGKGGSNPYQIFTTDHVEMARIIRMAQSLGFSLREIAALNKEHQAGGMTPSRSAEIMRLQLERLETKAVQLDAMIRYVRDKLRWIEAGGERDEPRFADYDAAAGVPPGRKPEPAAMSARPVARRGVRASASGVDSA